MSADVVGRLVDAFNERDVETIVRAAHPDGEIHALRSAIEGPYRGRSGARLWASQLFELAPDYRMHPEEIREHDGRVLILGRQTATAAGGMPIDAPLAAVFTFEGELILRVDVYATRDEALAAAGIAP